MNVTTQASYFTITFTRGTCGAVDRGPSHYLKVAGSSHAVSNVLCPWARHLTSIVSLYPGLNGELLGIWARLSRRLFSQAAPGEARRGYVLGGQNRGS